MLSRPDNDTFSGRGDLSDAGANGIGLALVLDET